MFREYKKGEIGLKWVVDYLETGKNSQFRLVSNRVFTRENCHIKIGRWKLEHLFIYLFIYSFIYLFIYLYITWSDDGMCKKKINNNPQTLASAMNFACLNIFWDTEVTLEAFTNSELWAKHHNFVFLKKTKTSKNSLD